jgi:hypothetical protein
MWGVKGSGGKRGFRVAGRERIAENREERSEHGGFGRMTSGGSGRRAPAE